MLQNQGQDLLQTLRAYQSQFSLGVSSPVGRNFKMRKWADKWMNPWIERQGREMDRQIKLIVDNMIVGGQVSVLKNE